MKLNQPSTLTAQEVLGILHGGLTSGTALALDKAFIDLVERLTNPITDLHFRNASEYEVCTYTISDAASRRGAVVKIVGRHAERLVRGLSQEFALLAELHAARSAFPVPKRMALFALGEVFVSVTELLQGSYLTEMNLSETDVHAIARTIGDTQNAIANTSIGGALIANARSPYYMEKIRHFANDALTKQHLNLITEDFDFAALEAMRRSCPVVVSDRSPANFIMNEDRDVRMFDFGLLLAGIPHEDWSWFIDDPRLRTNLTRDELLAIFIEATGSRHRPDAEEMFHRAAIFVNMKQYCLMSQTRRSAAEHYLSRVRQSAEALSADKVLRLVETLQSS